MTLRQFYRPAMVTALKEMDYVPADAMRFDYSGRGAESEPCFALVLRGHALREVSVLIATVMCHLHVKMDDERFAEWAAEFRAMLSAIRMNGPVVYFPGWTLTVH